MRELHHYVSTLLEILVWIRWAERRAVALNVSTLLEILGRWLTIGGIGGI